MELEGEMEWENKGEMSREGEMEWEGEVRVR